VPFALAMLLERRNGPHRLRDIDDDEARFKGSRYTKCIYGYVAGPRTPLGAPTDHLAGVNGKGKWKGKKGKEIQKRGQKAYDIKDE